MCFLVLVFPLSPSAIQKHCTVSIGQNASPALGSACLEPCHQFLLSMDLPKSLAMLSFSDSVSIFSLESPANPNLTLTWNANFGITVPKDVITTLSRLIYICTYASTLTEDMTIYFLELKRTHRTWAFIQSQTRKSVGVLSGIYSTNVCSLKLSFLVSVNFLLLFIYSFPGLVCFCNYLSTVLHIILKTADNKTSLLLTACVHQKSIL